MLFYVIIIVLYCIYLASACLLNETIRINSLVHLFTCRVFIVKMCGSLTIIPQKGNLFVFQVIFFDEKRVEYECIAVSHHQDTAPLQTGPLKQSITNRRSYISKPC